MTEITLHIPDSKLPFFIELMQQLGIDTNLNDIQIPEEHKKEVRNRIKTAKENDFIPWTVARKQLKFKN